VDLATTIAACSAIIAVVAAIVAGHQAQSAKQQAAAAIEQLRQTRKEFKIERRDLAAQALDEYLAVSIKYYQFLQSSMHARREDPGSFFRRNDEMIEPVTRCFDVLARNREELPAEMWRIARAAYGDASNAHAQTGGLTDEQAVELWQPLGEKLGRIRQMSGSWYGSDDF